MLLAQMSHMRIPTNVPESILIAGTSQIEIVLNDKFLPHLGIFCNDFPQKCLLNLDLVFLNPN